MKPFLQVCALAPLCFLLLGTPARAQAKRTVYSIIYGTSAMALGQQLGIPVAAAQTLKRSFLEHFPGVKSFISNVKESCRAKGFVQTILQRRR